MLHTSKLRSGSRNGFTPRLKSFAAALALTLLLPVAASAYTVILRNGRTVEIPATFSVTPAGITYEYAPGLYVTIQMTSIDLAATERANREPLGSLLSRAGKRTEKAAGASASSSADTQPQAGARRTLTDKELAGVRARREAAEAAYERRRVELGLPSIEETRLKREAEAQRLIEMAARMNEEEARSESYWRVRAEELREAIAVNEAEIDYLRSKLRESTGIYLPVAYTSLTPFPFVLTVPNRFPRGRFPNAPLGFPTVSPRAPLSGRIGFGGGATRGRVIFNPRGSYGGRAGRRGFGTRGVTILPLPVYAPFAYNYNNYDQGALVARLHELETERAGLQARWRLLEDEARRAGVPPGWLRK